MSKIMSYLKDENGASAAEYALILAVIGVAIAVAAIALGSAIGGTINTAAKCISATSANASTACT